MKMKTMMAAVLLAGVFGAVTASGNGHELTLPQISYQVQNAKTLTTAQINAILTKTITTSDVTYFKKHNQWLRFPRNLKGSLSEMLLGNQFKLVRDLSQDQINAISQETVNMIGSRLQAELKRRGRKIG